MKKTYMQPTIEVVKIQTLGMLAASLPKETTGVSDESEVLSRGLFFDGEY
jgi:hypothetical protein